MITKTTLINKVEKMNHSQLLNMVKNQIENLPDTGVILKAIDNTINQSIITN